MLIGHKQSQHVSAVFTCEAFYREKPIDQALSRIRRCCRKGLFPEAMWQVDPCCDEQASGTDAALRHVTGPESVIACLGAWFY